MAVHQPTSASNNDIPLFFNRKVVKPVKGGGKVPTVNPYGSSTNKPSSNVIGIHELQR